jgi:hypothetical protein
MTMQVEYFGGIVHGKIILENGQDEARVFKGELWFDRDIDGRWLVGVTHHHPSGAETTGAMVVKDDTVRAFIQVLGDLVAVPGDFAGEGLIIGPAWNGFLPEPESASRPSTPPAPGR